jgi:hypothetical protein
MNGITHANLTSRRRTDHLSDGRAPCYSVDAQAPLTVGMYGIQCHGGVQEKSRAHGRNRQ